MPPESTPTLEPDSSATDGATPGEARRLAAARRVKSAVFAAYTAFAILFILLSIKALVLGVFHTDPTKLGGAPPNPTEKTCADGIRALTAALDRAMVAAAAVHEDAETLAAFRGALSPEWRDQDRLGAVCGSEPRGADAYAALLRLRRAEEGFLGRQVVEIAPLRRDVEAYVPGGLLHPDDRAGGR